MVFAGRVTGVPVITYRCVGYRLLACRLSVTGMSVIT